MKAIIQNFRGAASAELNLGKIALIGGLNAAGKSSIAQAVGAGLTANPLPVRGVAKSSTGCLVRSGTAAGSVEIENDLGRTVIDWPKGKVATEGQPPAASPFAAGLSCIVHLPPKDKSETLARYLKSEPTREDLESAIKSLNLGKKNLDKLWEMIEQQGWDGAHAASKEKGARLKGQWEEYAGERYGSKKADSWLPADWTPDLEGASQEDLQARVTDAQDALEAAIAAEAVSDSKVAELEERAGNLEELKKQLQQAEEISTKVATAAAEAKKKPDSLPPAKTTDAMGCPKCHTSLTVVNGKLVTAPEPLSEKGLKKRREAIDKASRDLEAAQADDRKADDACHKLADQITVSEAAAKELAELRKKPAGKGSDVDACRNELADAQARLKAWQTKTAADNRHFNIQINQQIVSAFASDGVRLTKLEKAIKGFNQQLARICQAAGWEPVSMDKDLEAHLAGTPYYLLSKSERYRVRVALQLVMASMDGSAAVIIDGADTLVDKPLRNGLFKVLAGLGFPSLVCMALTGPEDLPDLSAKGLGTSYWIDGEGYCHDLAG